MTVVALAAVGVALLRRGTAPVPGGFRFRADDGPEASATYLAGANGRPAPLQRTAPVRLRFLVAAGEGEGAAAGWRLRLEVGASSGSCASVSSWSQVPAAGGEAEFRMAASPHVEEGEATSGKGALGTPEGFAFRPGELQELASETSPIALETGQFTEVEFGLEPTVLASPGVTYCFRLTDAGQPGPFTPRARASATVSPVIARVGAFRFRSDDGPEAAASFAAPEGASLTGLAPGTGIRLRVALEGAGASRRLVPRGELSLEPGEPFDHHPVVVDDARGLAYLGTYGRAPARIVRLDLAAFARSGELTLSGAEYLTTAVVDATGSRALFGADMSPGLVVSVDVDPAHALTETGRLALPPGLFPDHEEPRTPTHLGTSILDPTSGLVWFGTHYYDQRLVRVEPSTLRLVDSFLGAEGETGGPTALFDPATGRALLGNLDNASQGRVIQLQARAGAAIEAVAAADLRPGEQGLSGAALDPRSGLAYFSTGGKLVRIDARADPVVRRDGLELPSAVSAASVAALDPDSGVGYFGTDLVIATSLDPLAELDRLQGAGEGHWFSTGFVDVPRRHVYLVARGDPGRIVRARAIDGLRLQLEYTPRGESCAGAIGWTKVPRVAAGEHWELADSEQLHDGEPTTVGAGLGARDGYTFTPGVVLDATAETPWLRLDERLYTELELSLRPTAEAAGAYCFRLADAIDPARLDAGRYAEASVTPAGTRP